MNKSEVMSVEYHRVILMKKPSSWAYKLLSRNKEIVKSGPHTQTPKAQPQPSQTQPKSVRKGLGLTLKSYGPPTPPPTHPTRWPGCQARPWSGSGPGTRISTTSLPQSQSRAPRIPIIRQQEQASNLSSRLAKKLNKQVLHDFCDD